MITKINLAGAVELDRAAAMESIHAVRAGSLSTRSPVRGGAGLDRWLDLLESHG